MDAIPSLCASTASCGAAATGFAFGRPSPTRGNETDGTNGGTVNPSTPLAARSFTSTPASHVSKPGSVRRPQSASVPRNSSWAIFKRPSLDGHWGTDLDNGQQKASEAENKAEILGEEPEERTGRSPWARRVSTIAQSQDGSTVSTPRPSTPSVFSNGSNAPFLESNRPVTPRNRLVKRSTSHRVLHSGSYSSGSPFLAAQTPIFRRPATSHQRSAQLELQREFDSPNRVLGTFDENQPVATVPEAINTGCQTHHKWQPYFQTISVKVASDTPRRSASLPRISSISSTLRHTDTIRCIQPPLGQTPALVKGNEVEKYPDLENSLRPTTTTYSSPLTQAAQEPHPKVVDTPTTNRQNGSHTKPRSSFSLGDIMSTPSPPWKMKGGSLRRKKGREAASIGRTTSSAPQKSSGDVLAHDSHSEQEQDTGLPALAGSSATSNEKVAARGPSSPLPPLSRLSAFEIELPGEMSSGPPSPFDQSTSPSARHNSETHPPMTNSSIRMKTHRNFRIPSDRESTVFSSDNEQGRVFSADGDDTDYRSETLFDSIRTDATSSSHSGAKSHRIETVFRDADTPELAKHNLAVLQEKLGQTSISGGAMQHDYIAEEDENVRTPLQARVAEQEREETVTPQRPQVSASTYMPSSPPTLPTPTRQIEEYPQELEFEDEWSADDGDDEHDDDETQVHLPSNFLGSGVEHLERSRDGLPERPKSNIFDWSERQSLEKEGQAGSSPRPRTAHVKQNHERGSRSTSRRGPSAFHLRSQSVPLPPENSNHRFNNSSKLDAWILGGKGVSEDWDNDFEFDEDSEGHLPDMTKPRSGDKMSDSIGVLVPPAIIEKQASVHGQFGQVKELTLLVEELRRLRHSAFLHGILHGQASELWKEAEGIIDLATLDEEEGEFFPPHSPTSTSFDFDAFEEDATASRRRRSSASPQVDGWNDGTPSKPSPALPRFDTPTGRPRKESIAKAKNVLENIHQHRSTLEPVPDAQVSPKKLPFDTTSLRDLVTRAGVVTRALKEIIRRVENPDSVPHTPEKNPGTPPDPPFSQIFQQPSPSSPSSAKKSPRVARRDSNGNFMSSPKSPNDNDLNNGHMKIMTVV